MSFTRFAIYYVPAEGKLATFGARWLGWDVAAGAQVSQPDVPDIDDITMMPRKYGFHGTLKPPFRLANGMTVDNLAEDVARMAAECPAAKCDGLALTPMGRFLALTPEGDASGINRIARSCVTELDRFRAPASETELARRRKARLSARQEAHLMKWGYPYVLEDFRFHMTLTGRLKPEQMDHWAKTARQMLPELKEPFFIDEVAMVGERQDGYFQLIQSYALTG